MEDNFRFTIKKKVVTSNPKRFSVYDYDFNDVEVDLNKIGISIIDILESSFVEFNSRWVIPRDLGITDKGLWLSVSVILNKHGLLGGSIYDNVGDRLINQRIKLNI